MEVFCKDLRDQAMKIINYEKKKEIILTNEEKESYEKQTICYICKKEFSTDKKTVKSEIIVTIQANIEELHTVFVI